MQEEEGSFRNWLAAFLPRAFWVSLLIGGLEALVVAAHVLAGNDVALPLLLDTFVFLNVGIAIFFGALLAANLVLVPIVFSGARRFVSQLGLARFGWFCNFMPAIWFSLLYWVNFNSGRALLSVKSIIFNALTFVAALILAAVATRIMRGSTANLSLLRQGKPRLVAAIWCTALVLALVFSPDAATGQRSPKPNVLLLIIDTLRADRVGAYGYDKPTTPAIDKIAENAVLFEQAYVQWASSLPSHSSFMTSLYPYQHGAFPNGKLLNPKLLTLSKILREYGYKNGAFVSNTLVGNQYNFELGYDTFTDLTKFDYRDSSLKMWLRTLNLVRLYDKITGRDLFTDLSLAWIEKHQSGPFFLWGQWLHPHAPYEPPARHLRKFEKGYHGIANGTLGQIFEIRQGDVKLSEKDQAHYSALYDGEVAWSDDQIGAIYDKLDELNLLDNSIVIITSDHGENMLEHGLEYGHAGVNEASVRIPLIVRLPDGDRKRIPQVVQSIDVAPTILELLDIPAPEQFQGRSTVALMKGEPAEWRDEAYSVGFWEKRNFFGMRKGEWKLILDVRLNGNTWSLYHLPSDPHERNNLYEAQPDTAAMLTAEMEAWLKKDFQRLDLVYKPGGFFEEDFDEKTVQRLRTLGYIK